jgi:hypothetical protein
MLAHVTTGVEVLRSSGVAAMDFATCEQPDELIQLAWNAGADKKTVIREGADAAMLLLAGERTELATLFWPVPRPLEVVNRWAENPRPVAGVSAALRPFASAVIPGCIVGMVVARFLTGVTAMTVAVIASIAAIGVVLKVLIGASLKRQAARLDEAAALAIVLAHVRRGMARNAALVPRACTWLRRGLQLPGVSNQL